MKRNFLEALKRDLWVVLLDIVAVNAAYFAALGIRFYVNFTLRPVAVDRYLPALTAFAPWYTVACLVIFLLWRLYGGMWRYAGINDMNRIVLANLCTAAVHIAGTLIFYTRMPITYYLLGALIQFLLVTAIRFAYRVLLVEKKKLRGRRGKRIDTVVIGAGENGRRVLKNLEEEFRPVAVVGEPAGTMDGIPIQPLSEVKWENVGAVFIADPLLPLEDREEIRRRCSRDNMDFYDYTGYFSNLGGRLSFTELMATVHGPFIAEMEGTERTFRSGEEALDVLTERYEVTGIAGKELRIRLRKQGQPSAEQALRDAYAAVLGEPAAEEAVGGNGGRP